MLRLHEDINLLPTLQYPLPLCESQEGVYELLPGEKLCQSQSGEWNSGGWMV